MRAYMLTCLSALCLCTMNGCSEDDSAADAGGGKTRPDAGKPGAGGDAGPRDAGPQSCNTQGTWRVTLDLSDERCGPHVDQLMLGVNVEDGADAGADAFMHPFSAGGISCGNALADIDAGRCEPRRTVSIAADRCTVTASSLARWGAGGEPQCDEFKLTLHVHGDSADVEGSYRKCWCGTGGPQGTTVQMSGTAVRD
jgi:hypothetical protein